MILFLLVFSALQSLSSGQYATEIDDCIRNGVNASSDSIISERNLTKGTCGFLMQANDYIVVQPNKVNISEDSRIRLYLIISTNDSITKHKVSEFYNESLFRNSVFVGAGRQSFALVVLSKNKSTKVGEFEFLFRTRCSVALVAEDFPTFTSPNYCPNDKALTYILNNNLRDKISCLYEISSRHNRPFIVRFTSYQYHSGMILVINDLHMVGKSEFRYPGDESPYIAYAVITGNKNFGGFRAAVDINPNNFMLEPHHHHGFMLYNNAVVCHNSFHVSNAKVYCRYLGYPGVRNLYQNSSFHTTGRSVVNLQCAGSETSPANCSVSFAERCEITPINGVICQDVALAGGNDTNEGRVEIYYKGRRGLLCDDFFDMNSGNVICRQLGFRSAVKVTLSASGIYGYGNSVFLLDDLKCKGHETSIHKCYSKRVGSNNCNRNEVSGLVCSHKDQSTFSLVPRYHQGFLVYNNSLVCRNSYNIRNAKVYCRYLGYQAIQTLYENSSFDTSRWPVVNLQCHGSERTPAHCFVQSSKSCGMNSTLGVVCQDQDIFMLEPHHHQGIMIYDNAIVCQNSFNMTNAKVYCRSLGYPGVRNIYQNSSFHTTGRSVVNLLCTGLEMSPTDCRVSPATQCEGTLIYGVICQDVVLAGGNHANEGRVEIYYMGRRGLLCDDFFDMNSGNVICTQLGFRSAVKVKWNASSTYGYGNGMFLLDDLKCNGNETSIHECHSKSFLIHNCNMSEVSGLVCSQKEPSIFSLVPYSHQGFLVYNNSLVCRNTFSMSNAKVYCRYLGYQAIQTLNPNSSSDTSQWPVVNLQCNGSETSPGDCPVQSSESCGINSTLGVICQDLDIFSLVPHNRQGFMLHNNRVVCQNSFNLSNAKVYCRYLGYPGIKRLYQVSPSDIIGRPTVYLQCNGSEYSPAICQLELTANCERNSTIGVVCQDVALAGGKDTNEGRVEIYYKGKRGLLCDTNFNMKSGTVICRQLGFRSAVIVPAAYKIFGSGNELFLIDNLRCYGYEESIHECSSNPIGNYQCQKRHMVGLVCSHQEPAIFSLVPNRHKGLLVYDNYFVCQNDFHMNIATVYCRYLGFPGVMRLYLNLSFNKHGRQVVYLKCNGSETSPAQCDVIVRTNCTRMFLLGVVCQSNMYVALARGKDTKEGRVEIYYEERRAYMCYIRSQMESGNVICKQLGFRFAVKISMNANYVNDLDNRRYRSIDLRCLGNESSIHECEWSLSSCDREHISHLVCSEKDPNTFSLVPHHHQGLMLYNNSVVCRNSFNATNAMVYCRYLGYPGVRMLYTPSSFDITGRSTVILQCNGSEMSPADCRVIHTETCKETSTVGVVCQDVALAGGNNTNEGRVEIYYKRRRGLLCHSYFDINAGHAICRQLGFSFAVNVPLEAGNIYGFGHSPFLLNKLRCHGFETSIHECPSKDFGVQYYCLWNDVVGVVCSQKENIQKQEEMVQKMKSVLKSEKHQLYLLDKSMEDAIKRKRKLTDYVRKMEKDLIRNEAKLSSMKTELVQEKTEINN